jgi:uncharacterized membrane protein
MATKEPNNKAKEIEDGKGMAILAYIIALIPYFAEKNNKFVRFHAIQGMNLLILAVGWSIIAGILNGIIYSALTSGCWSTWSYLATGHASGGMCQLGLAAGISFVLYIPSMIIGIVDIIGLIYAAQGQEKEVPILGKIKLIKK